MEDWLKFSQHFFQSQGKNCFSSSAEMQKELELAGPFSSFVRVYLLIFLTMKNSLDFFFQVYQTTVTNDKRIRGHDI